jgi:hypothetical protein
MERKPPLRRNLRTSEQGKRPALPPPRPKPKSFAVAFTRTNRSGGRRP